MIDALVSSPGALNDVKCNPKSNNLDIHFAFISAYQNLVMITKKKHHDNQLAWGFSKTD